MKKLVVFLLAIVLVLNLSGCCCMPGMFEDTTDTEAVVGDYGYNSYVPKTESETESDDEVSSSQPSQPDSQPSSQPSSQPQTSQPAPAVKDPKSYTMHDYYGMTINDVINIWGNDYTLANGLYAGGWAYIYYADRRCPFKFCYQSYEIPKSCSGNEKLAGILAYPKADDAEFLVFEGLSVVSSYTTVSSTVGGEYWINEMDGGYCYSAEIVQNHPFVFRWYDGTDIPWEISISFRYMY